MRAITHRLARLEVKLVPLESAESARLRERLHGARLRLAAGKPYGGTSQRRLENQFAVTGEEQILITLTGHRHALDDKACVEILRESGFLRDGRIRLIRLVDIPDGLDTVELAKFLRENGAQIT